MRIAIIPARGGSTRIPGKNIKDFHGQPIISYSIEKAFASGLFDRVIVSTDSPEIESVAIQWGAEVWRRSPEFGDNEVGTQAVVRECLMGIGHKFYDTICCIYATSPLMDVRDLTLGAAMLAQETDTTFVFSVGYPPLQDAGQFYWGRCMDFITSKPLVGRYTRLVHVAADRVCDINTPEDWARAEIMYTALETKEND